MRRTGVTWERLGAMAGLAFVALLLVGRSVGSPIETRTDPGQPGDQIASLLMEHRDDLLRGIYSPRGGVLPALVRRLPSAPAASG
jgi:hypothetical protein